MWLSTVDAQPPPTAGYGGPRARRANARALVERQLIPPAWVCVAVGVRGGGRSDISGVNSLGAILREIFKVALGTSIHNLDALLVVFAAWSRRTQTTAAQK